MRSFRRSHRGQAIAITRLFLSLGVGAVMYWIIKEVTAPLFDHVGDSTTSGQAASEGTTYLQQGVDFLPIVFLMIAFFGLIAYSVYTREVLR